MPSQGHYWTTEDYVNLQPGVQMGLAKKAQLDRERERIEAAKERALANAVHDQEFKAQEMQHAAQMGVQPIMGPNGQVDWAKTAEFKQQDTVAEALGRHHGIVGDPTQIDTQTEMLMQLPGYQRGRMRAEAEMEQTRLKNEAAITLAERKAAAAAEAKQKVYTPKDQPSIPMNVDGTDMIRNPYTGKDTIMKNPKGFVPSTVKDPDTGEVLGHWVAPDRFVPVQHMSAQDKFFKKLQDDLEEAKKKTPGTNAPSAGGKGMHFDAQGNLVP